MSAGRWASAALMLSGVAGIAMPDRVAGALSLTPTSSRGVTETRAGLGGTYAALGAWAFITNTRVARTAIGVTWLGAAVTRLGSKQVDQPPADWTYWAFLAAEFGFGLGALASSAATAVGDRTSSDD